MPRPSRLLLAKSSILSAFSKAPQKIYSQTQLASVLSQHRHSWNLANHTTIPDFISFLVKHGDLRTTKFVSPKYGSQVIRYSWEKPSIFELATSIKGGAYLCHSTALILHGLAKPNAKMIYINVEQSAKPSSYAPLTQEAIDRAFSGNQRQSNLTYNYRGTTVISVSGKNTKRLGVEEMARSSSERLQVTSLERTLIDIIVRPAYAGGISQIIKAYRTAKARVSVDKLLSILNDLGYVYPYHQSIGFIMEKTGYASDIHDKLRALGLNHDFYLAHGMRRPKYCAEWRVYYPDDIK